MSICPQQEHQVSALDFNIFDIFGVWSSTFLCSLKTTSTQHLYRPVQGQQQVHSTAILCCIHCSFSAPTALSLLAANTHTHTHTHLGVARTHNTHCCPSSFPCHVHQTESTRSNKPKNNLQYTIYTTRSYCTFSFVAQRSFLDTQHEVYSRVRCRVRRDDLVPRGRGLWR